MAFGKKRNGTSSIGPVVSGQVALNALNALLWYQHIVGRQKNSNKWLPSLIFLNLKKMISRMHVQANIDSAHLKYFAKKNQISLISLYHSNKTNCDHFHHSKTKIDPRAWLLERKGWDRVSLVLVTSRSASWYRLWSSTNDVAGWRLVGRPEPTSPLPLPDNRAPWRTQEKHVLITKGSLFLGKRHILLYFKGTSGTNLTPVLGRRPQKQFQCPGPRELGREEFRLGSV